jgi:hypothetical protein
MMDNRQANNKVPDLTQLTVACKRWVDEGVTSEVQVYNLATCVEFHQLFLVTVLAYGRALDALFVARTDGGAKDEVALAQRVWHCATILWRIAYSGILRHHLELLSKKNWLVVPIYDEENIELFQEFTDFDHPDYRMKHPATKGGLVMDGDGQDENENEEQVEFEHMKASADTGLIFRRWIHAQVSHWEALSVMSKHATIVNTSIQFHLLAVRCPNYYPHSSKVAKWVPTVKTLIKQRTPSLANGERIDADAVIGYLKSQIGIGQKAKYFHPIFHRFSNEDLSWKGFAHCEAWMASLMNFTDRMTVEPTSVGQSIKVLSYFCDHNIIVSRVRRNRTAA